MTTTKPPTLTCDELINAMEALSAAWAECGERPGIVADALDEYDWVADLLAEPKSGSEADTLIAEIEARCPGLLAAAHSYANHIEAGQPDYDQQRFIRRLFTAEMGRDPFGQPTPG